MHSEYSHYSEDKLNQRYDLKLLSRLLPLAWKYKFFFFGAVFLVVLITLLDISLPYVTKIAIDRYIVPNVGIIESGMKGEKDNLSGFYRTDMTDPSAASVVRKYPDLFMVEGNAARVPYEKLAEIESGDIALLREKDLRGVAWIAGVIIVIVILVFALNFFQVMIMEYTGQMMMHDLRMKLFIHIQGLSVAFFARNPVGRLVTRTTNDIQNMHEMFTSIITFMFKDLFLLIGITIVLLSINTRLALVTLTVLPILVIIALKFAVVAREAFREIRIKIAEINSRFSETIEGIRIVQLFRQESKNYQDLKKLNHEHYLAGMRQVRVFAVFMPLIELMGTVVVALIIFYGGSGVLDGAISLGSLVAFISYMRMFFRPIRDIAEKVNIMQNALASAERIFLILDKTDTPPDKVPVEPVLKSEKIETLTFQEVSFSYGKGKRILNTISFSIQKSEAIAIVGPTGAGKTSLINLIIRFYDPLSGKILINNRDIRSWPVAEVRKRVALVTQDPFLFSGSIRENIVGAGREISERELAKILDASNCQTVVDHLPEGVDTILSERGSSISSGERQLISIARALASDPDLIILDEATSYVDSDTELKIQDAMERLLSQRTTLIIAHRLSTARKADRIMVLNQGEIIETGSHDELLEKKGFYYRLNQLQG